MESVASHRVDRSSEEGWQGRLDMTFDSSGGRTVMRHCAHQGPLRVQRPFYPDADGTCHVYLLHPPGGVVGGDILEIEVAVGPDAKVLVTTPGATKLYRSRGPRSVVRHRLKVGRGARLEWLPQETIAFSGARVESETRVEVAAGATYIGWDVLCLGRPASAESFDAGMLTARLEVWRAGVPVLCERLQVAGNDPLLREAWGLRGHAVMATLVVVSDEAQLVHKLRASLGDHLGGSRECCCSGSQLEGAAVFRAVGHSTRRTHETLTRLWVVARDILGGIGASIPRIWAT